MFYDILPDGIVCFYAAQATPNGPSGFLAPFINALVEAIALPSSKWAKLLERHHITSVLPLKDMRTGVAQKFYYANGTKHMDRKGIVYVFSNTSDSNSTNYDQITLFVKLLIPLTLKSAWAATQQILIYLFCKV